jgi:SAM-dependent methyltransferase
MIDRKELWYRLRSFEQMEDRFGKDTITGFLAERLKTQKTVRVLEIGFGEGRCLLELQERFPQARLFGVNYPKTKTMASGKDLARNAKDLDIAVKRSPRVAFYDVNEGLRFPDGYFDVIMSQVAIHYVGDKARLYEEAWRVLKADGRAFLHVDRDREGKEQPEFVSHKADTPLMVILDGKSMISTKKHLEGLRKKGFDLAMRKSQGKERKNDQFILLMRKSVKKPLRLGLVYDDNSTLSLSGLKRTSPEKTDSAVWWGTRSVYRMKKS